MNKIFIKNLIFLILMTFIFVKKAICSFGSLEIVTERWLIPDMDGSMKYMDEMEAKESFSESILPGETISSSVFFFLFTEKNQPIGQLIQLNSSYSLQQSSFNPQNPSRIIIHGWRSRLNSPVNHLICNAYLSTGNYNIFIVDWGSISNTINYVKARYSVENVGYLVAEFIDFLHNDGNMNFTDLIVIGHSLGAHVAGIAGKKIKTGRIPIIYGLDPAFPLFSYESVSERLTSDDAEYVETIQTNAGILGFKHPIGKVAFYPNWGKVQKGCKFDWNGMCSHRRSYKFFAESIVENNFISDRHCDSVDKLWDKNCNLLMKRNVKMADINNKKYLNGIYYVSTNSKEPFGRG